MNLGRRLRQLRLARKLSQAQVEAGTGLRRSYVSRVECGHAMPTLRTLEKWASALDSTLGEVVGGAEAETPAERPRSPRLARDEEELVRLYRRMATRNRTLLRFVARRIASEDQRP